MDVLRLSPVAYDALHDELLEVALQAEDVYSLDELERFCNRVVDCEGNDLDERHGS